VLVETPRWKEDFHRWFDDDDALEVPLVSSRTVPPPERGAFEASSGGPPTALPRILLPSSCALTQRVAPLEIAFTTTCPGVPHWISMAYHPNWRVEGAPGVYLASPAFMMVVPSQPDVRLRFVRSGVDWAGIVGTLIGIGMCVALAGRLPVAAAETDPVLVRHWRTATTVVLTVVVVMVLVSLTRTIGSQYFARRAWASFLAADFARAGAEYDRALLFGRSHAGAGDLLFFRASSLFRRDDCVAAIPAYAEVLTRAPESVWAAESLYQIGVCEQRLGRPDAAARTYRRALRDHESSRWSRLAAERLREMEGAVSPEARP
jgi:hypothetical protein